MAESGGQNSNPVKPADYLTTATSLAGAEPAAGLGASR